MFLKKILPLLSLLLCSASIVIAQPRIPDHNGRWVVDNASIIDEQTEKSITTLVREHYKSTSNQIVVYTFNSLEGSTIEDYSNQVYNSWKLGSEKNNNGVLLAIGYLDHKIRIEVGYGLEPALTDLEASDIIKNEIKPAFKKGDFNTGILNGVQAIIVATHGTYTPPEEPAIYFWIGLAFFIFLFTFGLGVIAIIISVIIRIGKAGNKQWSTGSTWNGSSLTNSGWSDSSWSSHDSGSSDWDSGHDFSGDGGSSGGGGASDDW